MFIKDLLLDLVDGLFTKFFGFALRYPASGANMRQRTSDKSGRNIGGSCLHPNVFCGSRPGIDTDIGTDRILCCGLWMIR